MSAIINYDQSRLSLIDVTKISNNLKILTLINMHLGMTQNKINFIIQYMDGFTINQEYVPETTKKDLKRYEWILQDLLECRKEWYNYGNGLVPNYMDTIFKGRKNWWYDITSYNVYDVMRVYDNKLPKWATGDDLIGTIDF